MVMCVVVNSSLLYWYADEVEYSETVEDITIEAVEGTEGPKEETLCLGLSSVLLSDDGVVGANAVLVDNEEEVSIDTVVRLV